MFSWQHPLNILELLTPKEEFIVLVHTADCSVYRFHGILLDTFVFSRLKHLPGGLQSLPVVIRKLQHLRVVHNIF